MPDSETEAPQGIADLCARQGVPLHAFDLGRQLTPVDVETLAAVERGDTPWPLPFQGRARLGLVGETGADPFVWFLALPLDEAGYLHPAVRDDLLARLAEAPLREQDPNESDPLGDNPYGFTPDPERMAALHARAGRLLGREPSAYYEHVRIYLTGAHGWDQWAFLGLQGLADIAERLDEGDNAERVATAIPQLPATPFEALARQLEHVTVPEPVAAALLERAETATGTEAAAVLRGLTGATEEGPRRAWLIRRLEGLDPETEAEFLAAVAGRAWADLADPAVAGAFLEALAGTGQEVFSKTITELVALPGMREALRDAIADPGRSEAVSRAAAALPTLP
ncbi:MAG: DUF3549 family protein [Pseudomonadota bacterium]